MTRIIDLLNQGPQFSFEFFPPKTPAGEETLFRTLNRLKDLDPGFVSITCGAMGTARANTVGWARRTQTEVGLTPLTHVTCLGVPDDELDAALDELREAPLPNILALRGDPPTETTTPLGGSCQYAVDLIPRIKARIPHACIGAACYPEKHVDAPSMKADLEHLKRKADAGADFFITQLFFDNAKYFEFVGRARSRGILQPIIPGIMPIQNVAQIKRFTQQCGASIPRHLLSLLEQYQDAPAAVFHIGVAHAIHQSVELLEHGAPGVHFYTLNRSSATRLVVEALKG